MKKLFVSQPMLGKTEEEILEERKYLIAKAEERTGEKFEVLETFFKDTAKGRKPLWCLGESLKYLAEADLAVFAMDWYNARGCRIEYMSAVQYGIPTMEV